MAKSMDIKKEGKKQPKLSLMEKRALKKEKEKGNK